MRIRPFKVSKYCIGTCLTQPSVKQNRFKKKLRRMEKLKAVSYQPSAVSLVAPELIAEG